MAERQNNSMPDAVDSEELKRYLFFEADEAERRALEEKFFESDETFYELLDLENDLTDGYARNELDEADRKRFQASLAKSPERRAKLANAETLRAFVREETKAAAPPEIERTNGGFWERTKSFFNFFNFGALRFQYATAALLLLTFVAIGFLIYERRRDARELARLREIENRRDAEIGREQSLLHEQIETIRERERTLQNELAERRGQTEILSEQLESEQTEKARIERELEILKRSKNASPPQIQTAPAPLVASVLLAPVGGKGGGDDAATISIDPNATIVSATLQIPEDATAEAYSVRLNSAALAANVKVNRTKSGNKFVRVSFPSKNLAVDKENLLTASGNDGSRYNYVLRRRN